MRGRLAYNCCSLASSASRLAMSLDSCSLSNRRRRDRRFGDGLGLFGFCRRLSSAWARRWSRQPWAGPPASGLGGRRWRDFLHLVVLERRDLGGLGNRLLIQGAAALLIFLSEEIGLLWLLFAFEGGEGDFRVLLICLGSTIVKPTPSSKARWISAARNRVKPRRSAGRTPRWASSAGRSDGRVMTRKPTSRFSQAAA